MLKEITKTIEDETKEQKQGFLGILLGTLGESVLWNMLTGQRMLRAGYWHGKGMLRLWIKKKSDSPSLLNKTLKFKNIMKMNINLF